MIWSLRSFSRAFADSRALADDQPRVPGDGRAYVPPSGAVLLIGERLSADDLRAIASALSRSVVAPLSLAEAREALTNGHAVGLAVTPAGDGAEPFPDRYRWLTADFHGPLVPVHVERRRLESGSDPLVRFGLPLPPGATVEAVRLAQLELAADAAEGEAPRTETLADRFVQTAKRRWDAPCVADSTGRSLTFGRTLVAGLLLADWIRRHAPREAHVGLLLPATVAGALANIGVALAGRIAVNLNFTSGRDGMRAAVDRCQITTILTSKAFLDRVSIAPRPGMVFLEDLLPAMSVTAKLVTLIKARLLPARTLSRLHARDTGDTQGLATVIFSSGSTGVPKGIMLSHRNVLANIDAFSQLLEATPADVIVGVLPLFHSFGYTGTLWFPLVVGFGAVYHPNPMDAKTIGELCQHHRGTILMSTPTFCGSYIRKCQAGQFTHMRYVVVGAEKLRMPIAKGFREKFGIDLLEGYGCTELAPVVSVNIPGVADRAGRHHGRRPGSVGQPIPGVVAKIVDPETGEGPLFDREGLLLIKGPNVMVGYKDQPDLTKEAIRDGWYVTGDIARIDVDGFIHITDRLARFSKIGGEMVPHVHIEERVTVLIREDAIAAVTAVPDAAKGERLVVFYTDVNVSPLTVWERLTETELPRLWLPKREDIHVVESIPLLGSGKVDLRGVRQLALEKSGRDSV